MQQENKVKIGLTASTLKCIAVISMLIDHFGASIYLRSVNMDMNHYMIYMILRSIGRIAFPIYCFLLVEGFFHTKNIKKYIGRCFVFALISEIPFDMAIFGQFFYWKGQNVFFTLAIGLCVLWGLEKCKGNDWIHYLEQVLIVLAGCTVAQLAEVDYHYLGILFIVMFYYCRRLNPWIRDLIGALCFCYEITAPLAMIPIHLYNGEKGWNMKYLFYVIYPVHLLIYGLICFYVL